MDILKQIAELLCNTFIYFGYPKRHESWEFERGSETVVVTIGIIKHVRPEYKISCELPVVETMSSN